MSDYDDDTDGDETPESDEFEEQIKTMLRSSPFQAFEIVLNNGDRYAISSEFSLAIGESSMATIFPPKRGSAFFRKDQIVGVEVREPAV